MRRDDIGAFLLIAAIVIVLFVVIRLNRGFDDRDVRTAAETRCQRVALREGYPSFVMSGGLCFGTNTSTAHHLSP